MGLNFRVGALGVVGIWTPYLFYCYRSFGPYVNRLVDRREAALGEHGADVDRAVVQSDTSREGPGPLLTEPIDACLEPGQHGAPEAFEVRRRRRASAAGSDLAGFMSSRARMGARIRRPRRMRRTLSKKRLRLSSIHRCSQAQTASTRRRPMDPAADFLACAAATVGVALPRTREIRFRPEPRREASL